jgi:hypothetical protein
MKLDKSRFPLVKLPSDTQLSLYLIKEELKSRRLFHGFHEVGLDDCYFQPHLDSLILHSINMDDGTDETFAMYNDIMEKRSRKIEAANESIMKQALKAYHELLNAKQELQRKTK